jgi:hypothetical protein
VSSFGGVFPDSKSGNGGTGGMGEFVRDLAIWIDPIEERRCKLPGLGGAIPDSDPSVVSTRVGVVVEEGAPMTEEVVEAEVAGRFDFELLRLGEGDREREVKEDSDGLGAAESVRSLVLDDLPKREKREGGAIQGEGHAVSALRAVVAVEARYISGRSG